MEIFKIIWFSHETKCSSCSSTARSGALTQHQNCYATYPWKSLGKKRLLNAWPHLPSSIPRRTPAVSWIGQDGSKGQYKQNTNYSFQLCTGIKLMWWENFANYKTSARFPAVNQQLPALGPPIGWSERHISWKLGSLWCTHSCPRSVMNAGHAMDVTMMATLLVIRSGRAKEDSCESTETRMLEKILAL